MRFNKIVRYGERLEGLDLSRPSPDLSGEIRCIMFSDSDLMR